MHGKTSLWELNKHLRWQQYKSRHYIPVTWATWLGTSPRSHPTASLTFLSVVNLLATGAVDSYSVQMLLCAHLPFDLMKVNLRRSSAKKLRHLWQISKDRFYFFPPQVRRVALRRGGAVNPGVSPPRDPLCELAAALREISASCLWPGFSWHAGIPVDGAARWTPSQLVVLININANNTRAACWRTNKHVNNAATCSDTLDRVAICERVKDLHVYFT